MNKSNFAFLEGTPYAPCLEHLQKFEQLFVLQPKVAGHSLREFWERFTKLALQENGLWNDYDADLTASNKQDNLGNRLFFMRTCDNRKVFQNRPLPSPLTYTYLDQKGKPQTANRFEGDYAPRNAQLWLFDFFREYANAFHHVNGPSAPPYIVCFHQTLDYVTQLYRYLRAFLGLPFDRKVIDLRELPLCVNNEQTVFYIEDELLTGIDIPTESGCYSYTGTMYPNKDNKTDSYTAIIQLFDKKPDLPQAVVERGHAAYNATRRSKFGNALRDVRVLSGYYADTEYYILVYVFEQRICALNADELRNASLSDRLLLCRELAAIVYDLHNAKPQIHHRLLTHNCVWLCRDLDDIPYCPAIVGFSLAKINREGQSTTVMPATKRLVERLRMTDIGPYIPVEWSAAASAYGDQVDIYSLGILFTNILCGKFNLPLQVSEKQPITTYYPTIRIALSKAPEAMTELIIRMLNPIGAKRPSAEEVYHTLCEICR